MGNISTDFEEHFNFLGSNKSDAMLFHTVSFIKHLSEILTDSEFVCFELREKGKIKALLPAFIKKTVHGNILNSLPFYGCNGGVIGDVGIEEKTKLVMQFREFGNDMNVLSSTIISRPFEENIGCYDYDYIDSRIGQLTPLPSLGENNLEEELLAIFHYKTRNTIRKAAKHNVLVKIENNQNSLDFIYRTHFRNMEAIGGVAKPKYFFENIFEKFTSGTDFDCFIAYHNGLPISGLLMFYHGNYAEYYTPVIISDFRNLQPLSLIIFKAMQEAVKKNRLWWNWGGTWKSQEGVYQFKKRWGTEDHKYYYHVKIHDKSLLDMTTEFVLKKFPFYYVCPFNLLKK